MPHLYLFVLEIMPLEVGKAYNELPSHLTLMSRFISELSPEELTAQARPLFTATAPVSLTFGETMTLGPKKVTAHMVNSSAESRLHNNLQKLLDTSKLSTNIRSSLATIISRTLLPGRAYSLP